MERHAWIRMVSAILLVGLNGCGTVGEKEFACPGRPPGVRCMSAREVYTATEATDVVAPSAPDALGDDPRTARARGQRGTKSDAVTGTSAPTRQNSRPGTPAPAPDRNPRISQTSPLLPVVDKPMPIRTPAQVMRAWIAPWEDTQGRAHGGGNTFIEIETRRWLFGESESTIQPVRFFSIQKMDTKEPVGKDPRASQVRTGTSERSTRPNSSTLPNQGAPNESSQHKVDPTRR